MGIFWDGDFHLSSYLELAGSKKYSHTLTWPPGGHFGPPGEIAFDLGFIFVILNDQINAWFVFLFDDILDKFSLILLYYLTFVHFWRKADKRNRWAQTRKRRNVMHIWQHKFQKSKNFTCCLLLYVCLFRVKMCHWLIFNFSFFFSSFSIYVVCGCRCVSWYHRFIATLIPHIVNWYEFMIDTSIEICFILEIL